MKMLVSRKRLVKTFCELVRIKSPSEQEEEIAKNVIKRLKILGISVDRDDYGNIIAKIDGFGKPLILCAHLDTVAVGSEEQINPVIEKEKGEEVIISLLYNFQFSKVFLFTLLFYTFKYLCQGLTIVACFDKLISEERL